PVGITNSGWFPVCKDADGKTAIVEDLVPYLKELPLDRRKVLKDYNVKDYITLMGYGKSEREFSAMFVTCGLQFPEAEDYPYTEEELEDPTTKLFDELEEMLIVQRKKIADAVYYTIDHNGLYSIACQFNKDEIEAIVNRINTANTGATELIMSYLKTGKFRMTL
ncbi:MAG: hypothetical protein K2F99_09535, partial [Muribaculaceae bacterium]|nr:hypothetical protein [Muribaculaceae bacterium]